MFELLEKAINNLDRDRHKNIRFLLENYSAVLNQEWAMSIANHNVVFKGDIPNMNIDAVDIIIAGYIVTLCHSVVQGHKQAAEAYCNILGNYNIDISRKMRIFYLEALL